MHDLHVEGSYNVRDLGGYPTQDGRATRPGVLIRAGNLAQVSPLGAQQLLDYGARTIVDVRDEWETEAYPDVCVKAAGMAYLNLPFIGNRLTNNKSWKAKAQNYERLDELYQIFLEGCQPQVGAILRALAESEPAVVFHCHVGKDRTGLVSALVLGAAGVAPQTIADDYAATNPRIAAQVAGWRAAAIEQGQDLEVFERNAGAVADDMLRTLDHLEQHYGGATPYLLRCGVSQTQLNDLLARFVA